ncbi:MAG TPA: FG-GAP-like repeat-containing protein [Novosphingobium sp.]|nr:FG-GAP-like repeat-containing protein [Novosphingobium sp.]
MPNSPTEGADSIVGTNANDLIDGLGGNDTIDGLDGNDTLIGGSGNDALFGGTGIDSMIGGTGDDFYLVDDPGDIVVEFSGGGSDEVATTLTTYSLPAEVEYLVYNGAGNALLAGNLLNNVLSGRSGNDTLIGGGGDDTLQGDAGADSMIGGPGNDEYWVTDARDVVVEAAGEGTDRVIVSLSAYVLPPEVENLGLVGLIGVTANLTGNDLANQISGATGNDTIDGRGGADTMDGGVGDDTYFVDNPGDTIVEFIGAGRDTVFLTIASYVLPNEVENLTFIGNGSASLTGNLSANVITGGSGDDYINGGSGIDVAVFAASRAAATVARSAGGTLSVTSVADGHDRLDAIELLLFADGWRSFRHSTAGPAFIANFNPAFGWASQDQYPRHVADVNGDGYADIVGFGIAGVLVSFGSAGGSFTGAAVKLADYGQNSGWATDNGFHRELADVNGDGRADILGFGFAGTLVSFARADGTFSGATTGIADFGVNQGWANQNGFARTVGDVNGDGKADLVGFGYAGALVALGNGDGTFKPVNTAIVNFGVNQGWSSDDAFHRAVADVNGDGRADIVGFGIAGTYVALANADGTFANAQLVLNDFGANQGWASNDSFSRLVADVNGDHIADIVGFGTAGTLVAFGKGDGTFTPAGLDVSDFGKAQGWSSDNTYHREVADVNKDGLADIVGFGIAGVLVGQNQGDFLI